MMTRILSAADVERCLDLSQLRQVMRGCLASLSAGKSTNGPRAVFPAGEGRALGFMPASLEGERAGYKALSVWEGNPARGLNPHQGLVVLVEPETGRPKCLLEASAVTALRTAAVSAAASEALGPPAPSSLGLIGAGRQGWEHARALAAMWPLRRAVVWSREAAKAQALCAWLEAALGLSASVAATPEAAAQAEVVTCCTSSRTPLLTSDALPAGAHLNLVGACRPGIRELDLRPRAGLRAYVDSVAACAAESEEIRALQAADPAAVRGEVGQVLSGALREARGEGDLTVFKSVGLGVEDVAAAAHFLERAEAGWVGTLIDLQQPGPKGEGLLSRG
jgi:ornithine cyclodeaminase/alanine dehydrogenase-like protein (mu-crystallin family)